ncbi:MAG: GNAT family N-acetyltransferase [bacterium]|jgi:ribosomal-protein-alanine acetyltransferase
MTGSLKDALKRLVFSAMGKDPEGVVVSFLSGDPALAARMVAEIRELVPGRRHFTVEADPRPTYAELRRRFRRYRIALAPVLFDGDPRYRALRRAAFLLAPGKVLAYNARLERHQPRLSTCIASLLFLRGVPVHRIYSRPRWLTPWRARPEEPVERRIVNGRPFDPNHRRILVATPYVPYPLSHGGAVRMYNLLREAAREFDIVLFAFTEGGAEELEPLLEFCSAIVLVPKRENPEPRWSTVPPPETLEYNSPALVRAYEQTCREFHPDLRQVEYTVLAGFRGDILVEHDVTFDLHRQIYERERTVAAWWNWFRWRRFERRAVKRFRKVVVMSDKDAAMLPGAPVTVIPNGVGLDRFRPRAETPGARLLFVGSFRHFPNIAAYRFFTEEVWPAVRARVPEAQLTVVAGPDYELYWREATGTLLPPEDPSVRLLGFVRDVVPLYVETNLVVAPTVVSAGTNLKVLEAMAMRRAVVSTTSGCAGLGLTHGHSVWVADSADEFAAGVVRLLEDRAERERIAARAREIAENNFDWPKPGALQRALYRGLLGGTTIVREARESDVADLDRIQRLSPEAVIWEPHAYLSYDCRVAEVDGRVVGFIVSRRVGEQEGEVLSLIVDPAVRRRGVGARLLEDALSSPCASWFLEVRESNWPARNLYRKYGFQEVSTRPKYYQDNGETAVVMRLQSC